MLYGHGIQKEKGSWQGQRVLLAAPGPSGKRPVSLPYDKVISCNLAVLDHPTDLWVVIDRPLLIIPVEKRKVFMSVSDKIPLAAPHWGVDEWARDVAICSVEKLYKPTDPWMDGNEIRHNWPCFPLVQGCPSSAASIALYMGASELILTGVDYTGGREVEDPVKAEMIRWFWLELERRNPQCRFVQTNPESLVQFRTPSS